MTPPAATSRPAPIAASGDPPYLPVGRDGVRICRDHGAFCCRGRSGLGPRSRGVRHRAGVGRRRDRHPRRPPAVAAAGPVGPGAGLAGRARYAFRALVVIVALLIARPEEGASPETVDRFRHTMVLLLIGVGAWLLAWLALVAQEAALRHQDLSVPDNLRVRRLHTQVILLRRITVAVIAVTAVAAMLLTFASVRAIGASLLASAGVVGIVVGLAAQTTLSNVFAGLQLAFSDELRLDDVVVVEQEWGRIEE